MKRAAILIAAATVVAALAATSASAQRCPPSQCPTSGSDTYDCSDAMGHLRRVLAEEIRELPLDQRVWIQPICEGDPNQNMAILRVDGNASSLQSVIGEHPAFAEALAAKHYIERDVIGVRFGGGNTVILYVHKFGR